MNNQFAEKILEVYLKFAARAAQYPNNRTKAAQKATRQAKIVWSKYQEALRADRAKRGYIGNPHDHGYRQVTNADRKWAWKKAEKARLLRGAVRLAKLAELQIQDMRKEHYTLSAVDYVQAKEAKSAPYCDMGGHGIGLVSITRVRTYAKSCQWRSSSAITYYLVGRNEAGSYFAHAIAGSPGSVREALSWVWDKRAGDIVQRQGDIAIIKGAGPKMPSKLPRGHRIDEERGVIVHETHPDLPLPGKGQRVIVGRRAFARVSEETRD